METTVTRRKRTREEVLAWLDAARQRKAAFQRETNEWWQAEHLVEPEKMEQTEQRKRDEELVRKLHALHYDGEMTAEEMKTTLRDR